MKKVVVTDLEIHEPMLGFFGVIHKYPIMKNGENIRRTLTPSEVKINLANERAGVVGNLLHQGWVQEYVPERQEWVFTNKDAEL